MNKLETLVSNLRSINIPEIITDILRDQNTLNEIVRIVQERLYLDGTDAYDKKLRTDSAKIQGNAAYAGFTYQKKKQRGQKASNVTLNDTGGFHRSIKGQTAFKTVNITGDFEKDFGHIYDNFRTSYSSENEFEDAVLGLTESQNEYVAWQLVYEPLMKRLKQLI